MNHLVQDDSTRLCFVVEPVTRRALPASVEAQYCGLSDHSLLNRLVHGCVFGEEPNDMCRVDLHVCSTRRRRYGLGVFHRSPQRFFAQHALAGADGGQGKLPMAHCGGADINDVCREEELIEGSDRCQAVPSGQVPASDEGIHAHVCPKGQPVGCVRM